MLKSIGAILAGFLVIFVLSVATDVLMEKTGIFPSFQEQMENGLWDTSLLLLALFYRLVYAVLGGYVTASLAPEPKMRYVMILAAVGLVAGLIGLVATWDKGLGPHWYPILLALLSLPCAWVGAKLRK